MKLERKSGGETHRFSYVFLMSFEWVLDHPKKVKGLPVDVPVELMGCYLSKFVATHSSLNVVRALRCF